MPPQSSVIPARRFSFETLTVWALIGTIILSAIAYIPVSSIPFLYTKVSILGIGAIVTLVLFILARLTRGNVVLPPALMLGALWLPVAAYALSAAFSGVNATFAVFGSAMEPDTLAFIAIAAVLGTLSALALRRPEHYKNFLLAGVVGAGLLVGLEVLILILGQIMPSVISPSTALVGSLSDLASCAGLIVVSVLITMRLIPLSPRLQVILMVIGALALFLLALSNNALNWILIGLVSLGLFVESVMRRAPSHGDSDLEGVSMVSESESGPVEGERSLAVPLVTLAIALFFLIGGNLGNALANALGVSVVDVRPSWQSTLAVGQRVYSTSPVFGTGPSTFGENWLKYRDASINQTIFWNLDFTSGIGFIPTSFVTTGMVGVLGWLLFMAAILYCGARSVVLRAAGDPFIRFVTTLSFTATVYLFIIAIWTNAGVIPLVLAFVFAGVFASTLRFAPGKVQWGVIFSRSPRIGFVIVFLLTLLLLTSIVAAYLVVERYLAQIDVLRAQSELSSGNLDAAARTANAAITFVPSVAAYQIQIAIAQQQMNRILADTKLPVAQAQQQFQAALASGINAALSATRLAPNNYQNWMALGNLYAAVVPLNVQGAYDNAKSAFGKASVLNPTAPTIPFILAQLEISNKDAKAAQEALLKSISLKQDYTPAIFLLSQLEVASGNLREALAAAEAAAYFTPNDPTVLFQVGVLRAAMNNTDGAGTALLAAVTANPDFANARYFLAAIYAKKGAYQEALSQVEAIAALSEANASAVASLIADLKASKNPFPANLLSSPPPVSQ